MHAGQIMFAQVMDHLPLHQFRAIVKRYAGDYDVRTFPCLDQFYTMAFAQLTCRESLRDIETCLRANDHHLYHMGIRGTVACSTLADANELRDLRIYADIAYVLIGIAKDLYRNEPMGVEISDTVYALDSTTIDLCMSLFRWATFRTTKSAVKMHTLLDLRGSMPDCIWITEGKVHDVNIMDKLVVEPGAWYIMDRGYLDFKRLYALHQDRAYFVIRQALGISDQQFCRGTTGRVPVVPPQVGGGAVLQMGKAASAHQGVLWHIEERGQDTTMDRHCHLRAGCDPQEASGHRRLALHNSTDFEGQHFRENPYFTGDFSHGPHKTTRSTMQPTAIVEHITGQ